MPALKVITVTVDSNSRTVSVDKMLETGSVLAETVFQWNLVPGGPGFKALLRVPSGAFKPERAKAGALEETVFALVDASGSPTPVRLQAACKGDWPYDVIVIFETPGSNPPSLVPIVIIGD